MSNYPKWWDTTVTVYNRYQDPETEIVTWYKTVIDNCFWKYTGNKITVAEVILESNTIICRIPKDERYLPKYQWEKLPDDKKSDNFTLGIDDIIVQGNCDDEINEYQSGKRSSDMIKKYKELQGCMIIEAMADNTGTARNNKHYLVKGI